MFDSQTAMTFAIVLLLAPSCESDLDGKVSAQVENVRPATESTELAVARTLQLDSAASKLEFVGAKVSGDHRGRFSDLTGTLTLAEDQSVVGMDLLVVTASVDIEPERLERHLRSPAFFDVEKFPNASFHLSSFTPDTSDGNTHRVSGDLELHGVKKRITFPVRVEFSSGAASAVASFKINRRDFGIEYDGAADDLVKDDVLLEMTLSFRGTS